MGNMQELPNRTTTRRAALRQLAAGAGAAVTVFPILGQNPSPDTHHSPQPVTPEAASYTYRFFSREQLDTLDALGETLIPADDHSPGAKAARVSEYIDAIVSDAPARSQALWKEGLAAVERVAHRNFGNNYASCSPEQQFEIMTAFAGDEHPGSPLAEDFFSILKRATVDGYYTSKIGMFQDLGYRGNEALASFSECSHDAIPHNKHDGSRQ
jgi:Gluconate 2-dehydrogenase subunit 3